ncbi:MAG: hypothetical protein IJT54_08440 [Candidatus Methanomethylophilaceae archaeon]|nr:hypothetical protein [Candidatus Methanomethylophilaceae archaeon]
MKQKMLSMAALAFAFIMLATAIVPMVATDNSSAAYTQQSPQEVTVHMRVGDTFTYSPSVNIASGTVTYTMTSEAQDGVSFTSNTLTATFATSGTKTVMIKAHWESGTAGGYNNVTQDAYLRITFVIDERLAIVDETPTKILLVGSTANAGSQVYAFTKGTEWTGPTGASASNVTIATYDSAANAVAQSNAVSGQKFVWDTTNSAVKVGTNDLTTGTYYVRLNISYNNSYSQADTAYSILTVLISDDLKFVEENGDDFSLFRNLVADSANANHSDSWAVRTNLDSLIGTGENDVQFTSRTITAVENKAAPSGVTITGSPGTAAATPTFAFDASGISSITSNYAEYQYTIAAAGTYGNATLSESAVVTYHVYASAKFLNVPTVASTLYVSPSADNPSDVTITATVSNTDMITVYWGDGTSSKINTLKADNVSYTARHVYSSPAQYLISVVAENDNGTTSGMIYYDGLDGLTQGITETFDNLKNDAQNIIDEHGWLFIALIVVGAVMTVVCLIWYPDYRFIAIGLILVAIGAVIFFGGWKLP